jgi:hypothetical protein
LNQNPLPFCHLFRQSHRCRAEDARQKPTSDAAELKDTIARLQLELAHERALIKTYQSLYMKQLLELIALKVANEKTAE